jgi:LmbE family N-acetylglucosaminyl deacetylase
VFFPASPDLPAGFHPTELGRLVPGGPLLVVAPHPDDEVLGCGGLLAEAFAQSRAVHVAVMTDGAASHRSVPPAVMRERREAETLRAIEALGGRADAVSFLRLPDGDLGSPAIMPRAVAALACLLARQAPRTVVSPWQFDPHPDHIATAAAVSTALDRLAHRPLRLHYAVWAWARPAAIALPDSGIALDVGRHVQRRVAALAAHQSQLRQAGAAADGFVLPQALAALVYRRFELLFRHAD